MIEWYYARGGQQNGPVSFEQLVEVARSGGLNPTADLVWSQDMKDWTPAGQVPGIFAQAAWSAESAGGSCKSPMRLPAARGPRRCPPRRARR